MAIGDAQNDVEELGADDLFGSGDGRDDRLERADVIDPNGVEQHGHERNGIGEIGKDAPSEANFDQTMSSVEAQESIQVTANSGAPSGLDNGVAQPGEESAPERGKAPGSGSAGGTIRAEPPRELEKRAVERMVADKLNAEGFSPGEILTSALALPPSGGRGP